jgi:hypothetical protein
LNSVRPPGCPRSGKHHLLGSNFHGSRQTQVAGGGADGHIERSRREKVSVPAIVENDCPFKQFAIFGFSIAATNNRILRPTHLWLN